MSLWLVLDVSNIAYRSMYSVGPLSHEGVETGVAFSLFREVQNLRELFSPVGIAYCFDRGCDKRKEIAPEYKQNRHQDTEKEKQWGIIEQRRSIRRQLYRLRTRWLPELGCRNVFWRDGYEADDVIASVCQNLPDGDEAMIVSTDHDLWQLLGDKVSIWNPATKKPMTKESFVGEWGIEPSQWASVLALAGCPGDNVIGLKGIGFKKAVEFLAGRMKANTKSWEQMAVAGPAMLERNLRLVKLPFPGVGKFRPGIDTFDERRWKFLLGRLGMKSLGGK